MSGPLGGIFWLTQCLKSVWSFVNRADKSQLF